MHESKPPNEFDLKRAVAEHEASQSKSIVELAQEENLSVKNVVMRQQQLQHLFLWLIGIGLGLGAVVSVGVVVALKKFGLAEKPYERENRIQQEQVQEDLIENSEQQ